MIGISDRIGRYCFLWSVIGLKNPDRAPLLRCCVYFSLPADGNVCLIVFDTFLSIRTETSAL